MVNRLKPGVHLNDVAKFSCFLTEKVCMFIINIIWLIRVREVVTACCENHTECVCKMQCSFEVTAGFRLTNHCAVNG
jgi:hypothetical protein